MMTDEDLLRAFVRDRSREAFDEILRRHGGMVFGVCRRALGDAQEAEDAAQSVFVIFLEKAPRLDGGTVVGAWLYRTAVFVSRNQMRSRIRRDTRVPEPASAPAADPAWEEAKPHLDDALGRLPERLQEALVVHYLQGKTLVQTAAALRCPVKTLEKRVGRGLERMRELLSGAGVAISSAALVALLQSEAKASVPGGLELAFRGRPLPPAEAPSRLQMLSKKLLLPVSAGLVVVASLAGAIRVMSAPRELPVPVVARKAAPAALEKPRTVAAPAPAEPEPPPAAEPAPAFPSSFGDFAALFRKLRKFPESLERWTALGISLKSEDLSRALARSDGKSVDVIILDVFSEWSAREARPAAEWLYKAYAILPSSQGWAPECPQNRSYGKTLMQGVLENWIRRDAAAVAGWVNGLPAGEARNGVLVEYVLAAGSHAVGRFDDFAAKVDKLPVSPLKATALINVAEAWAKRDPKAAAAWIMKLPVRPQQPTDGKPEATFSVGNEDSETELRPFASIQSPHEKDDPLFLVCARESALDGIAGSWAESDPEAAIKWSQGLPGTIERERTLQTISFHWAERSPQAVLEFALAHPGAAWRDGWLSLAAEKLAPKDRAAADKALQAIAPANREDAYCGMLKAWGQSRPQEAAPLLLQAIASTTSTPAEGILGMTPAELSYGSGLANLTRSWAEQDLRGAAAWAAGVKHDGLRLSVCATVADVWSKSDPRAVIDWAGRLPTGGTREAVLSLGAKAVAATDLELAKRIAGRIGNPQYRMDAWYGIATESARTTPELALGWARTLPSADEQNECLTVVLVTWAERDVEKAKSQVGVLTTEEARQNARECIESARLQVERNNLRKKLLEKKP